MNTAELDANPVAADRIVHDLNADPRVPLAGESVDDVVCCVSIDYLTRPVEVFRDVARVLKPSCTCAILNIPFWAVRHIQHLKTRLDFQAWIAWEGLSLPVRMIMPARIVSSSGVSGSTRWR